MKLIECVPNISEGRDKGKRSNCLPRRYPLQRGTPLSTCAVRFRPQPECLHFIRGLGNIEEELAALWSLTRQLPLIDMAIHTGVHPRIGAVDVVPFIPLRGSTMEEAIGAAHRFGNDFGERNCIPVYFYGEAALSPERKELFHIRRGGYEVLKEKLRDPKWTPDAGMLCIRCTSGSHSCRSEGASDRLQYQSGHKQCFNCSENCLRDPRSKRRI